MNPSVVLLPALLVLPLQDGAPPSSMDLEQVGAALQAHLDDLAERDAFSGAALLAVGDDVVLRRAWGKASRRYGVDNRPDTKFNIGSMNKMFTGVAVCQLVEQGRLSFDTKIGEVLEDYPNEDAASKVTVAQLLTHTSGIGGYWNERLDERWQHVWSVADYLDLFASDPLRFEPGERFEYSNGGPIVLGRMIEVLTGGDYHDYVREHVTGPLGMKGTDCYGIQEPVPNLAMGYTQAEGDAGVDGWIENTLAHVVRGGPAGGGYTTVDDMLRFARGLQAHELLGPEMTATYLQGRVSMGPGAEYGYLIGSFGEGDTLEHGHNGGAPGISAVFGFLPGSDVTFVILANQDGAALEPARFLRALLFGEAMPGDGLWIGVELDLGQVDGVLVRSVVPGGPAEAAGVKANDVITAIEGEPAAGERFLALLQKELATSDPFRLRVVRDGAAHELDVTPGRRP